MAKKMGRGMAVAIGPWFVIVPKKEIDRRGIKLRKTDRAVYVNGKGQPLWVQQYWNQDTLMKMLFDSCKNHYLIKNYLVDDMALEQWLIEKGELEVVYSGRTGERMLRIAEPVNSAN